MRSSCEERGERAADPKRKKEKRDKDPNAPKASASAYMYFSKHHRPLLKTQNPQLNFGDLGRTVGAKWKAADEDEREPFERMANEDKLRYEEEMRHYKQAQHFF